MSASRRPLPSLAINNQSRAQEALGDSTALVDQLYLKLVSNIKPSPDSFFSLLFPGRPLNLLSFIDTSAADIGTLSELEAQIVQTGAPFLCRKQRIVDAEFNLADQIYPTSYAVSGATGDSLSALYVRMLNNVVPKLDQTLLHDQLAIIERFTRQAANSQPTTAHNTNTNTAASTRATSPSPTFNANPHLLSPKPRQPVAASAAFSTPPASTPVGNLRPPDSGMHIRVDLAHDEVKDEHEYAAGTAGDRSPMSRAPSPMHSPLRPTYEAAVENLSVQPGDDEATRYIRLTAAAERTRAQSLLDMVDIEMAAQQDADAAPSVRDVERGRMRRNVYDINKDLTYWHTQLQGNAHEVQSMLSFVDVTSPGEQLLRARYLVRQMSVSGLSGSRILPVRISPSDWAYRCYGQEVINQHAADMKATVDRKKRWAAQKEAIVKTTERNASRRARALSWWRGCLYGESEAVHIAQESYDWLVDTTEWYLTRAIQRQQALIAEIQHHFHSLHLSADDTGDELLAFLRSRIARLAEAHNFFVRDTEQLSGVVQGWAQRVKEKQAKEEREQADIDRQARQWASRTRTQQSTEVKTTAGEQDADKGFTTTQAARSSYTADEKEKLPIRVEVADDAEDSQNNEPPHWWTDEQPQHPPHDNQRESNTGYEKSSTSILSPSSGAKQPHRTDWSHWFDDVGEDGAIDDFLTCCRAQPSYERYREVMMLKQYYSEREREDNDSKWAAVQEKVSRLVDEAQPSFSRPVTPRQTLSAPDHSWQAAPHHQSAEQRRLQMKLSYQCNALSNVCDMFLRSQVRDFLDRTRRLWLRRSTWPTVDTIVSEWRERERRNINARQLSSLQDSDVRLCIEANEHYTEFAHLSQQLEEWYRHGYNARASDGKSPQTLLGELCAERITKGNAAMTQEVYSVELKKRYIRSSAASRGGQGHLPSTIEHQQRRQERELNVSARIQISFHSLWLDFDREWLLPEVFASSQHYQSIHDPSEAEPGSENATTPAHGGFSCGPFDVLSQPPKPRSEQGLLPCYVTRVLVAVDVTLEMQSEANQFASQEAQFEAVETAAEALGLLDAARKDKPNLTKREVVRTKSSNKQEEREACQLRIPGAQIIGMISKFTPRDLSAPYYTSMSKSVLSKMVQQRSAHTADPATGSTAPSAASSTVVSRSATPVLSPRLASSPRTLAPNWDWGPHGAHVFLRLARRVWRYHLYQHRSEDGQPEWLKVPDDRAMLILPADKSKQPISSLLLSKVRGIISSEQHAKTTEMTRREPLASCCDEWRGLTVLTDKDVEAFVFVFETNHERNAVQSSLTHMVSSIHPAGWKLTTTWQQTTATTAGKQTR